MGRKVKWIADPSFAQPHAAGSKLTLVQPAVHAQYGVVSIAQPNYWGIHLAAAEALRQTLRELDARIEQTEIDANGSRSITNPALVRDLYFVGATLALHTVIGAQHLVMWLEQLSPANTGASDLGDRLKQALKRLGYRKELNADTRYTRLMEIVNIRHAVEHPRPDNVYTVDPNGWDRIPITWIASGRAAAAFDAASEFLHEIRDFAKACEARRKGNVTLQVRRGMKVENPARKPRRS